MCVIIAKYFDDLGWVGIKNRDRNYVPDISFKRKKTNGQETLYFWDDITQYCEGINSHGVAVLSASLMVSDDEKEIQHRSSKSSPSIDGIKIRRGLTETSAKDVAKRLIKEKLTGHTLIFDQNDCYILEGAWREGEYESGGYDHFINQVPQDQFVARTNHGEQIERAGYQRDDDPVHTTKRISSECRRLIAEYVTEISTTPVEIMDRLTEDYTGNGQLNALRTTDDAMKMRTTSQTMIIPKEKTIYVRPIQSNISFDFWKMNSGKSSLWVEILSNRVLYDGQRDQDTSHFKKLQHKL